MWKIKIFALYVEKSVKLCLFFQCRVRVSEYNTQLAESPYNV